MSDLISRELLVKEIVNRPTEQSGYNPVYLNGCATRQNEIIDIINDMPTVEAVPKSYAEQIRWERDVAVKQLNEIGCQFGQKMDEVKKKLEAVPVVYGEWIHVPSSDMATGRAYECSNCKKMRYGSFMPPFCQMCGADMRTSAE